MKQPEFASSGTVSRRRGRSRRRLAIAALLAGMSVGFAATGWAIFVSPVAVPIDRVIANVEARLDQDPDDVEALYTLARAHYLAFVNKTIMVPVNRIGRADLDSPEVRLSTAPRWMTEPRADAGDWGDWGRFAILRARATELALEESGLASWDEVPEARLDELLQRVAEHLQALRADGWWPESPPVDELLAHVEAALDAFEAVIAQSPDNGLYRLGLASLYDQYVQFRATVELSETPRLLAITPALARDTYYEAYAAAIADDRTREDLPVSGIVDLVGHEAGIRYLQLADEIGPQPSAEERARRAQVRADVDALERLPQRAITPLVLSLQPADGLAGLLDEHAAVLFDLDGNDRVETWSWVRPIIGILVWDPLRTGEITSGRQLFGNATWWLLFADGYRALDTLDDDRDGNVAGAELDGLAVWFDRNVNGRSEPGEVVPIEWLPIRALGTRPDGREGGGPRHSRGLQLADGQVLPTWDWIARRVDTGPDCIGACASATAPASLSGR